MDKGGVYLLQLRESGQVMYVGSTSNYSMRERAHKCCARFGSTALHATLAALALGSSYDTVVAFVRIHPTDISLTRRERAELEQRQIDLSQPQFNTNRAHALQGNAYFREYRIQNRDRIRQYMAEYRRANSERIRAHAKAARDNAKLLDPDAVNAYFRRYRAANKQKTRQYMANYREANRDKMNQYAKAYRDKARAARILASLAAVPEVPAVPEEPAVPVPEV